MKTILRVVLLSLIVFSVFTTCDSSPGMGDSIDWEAPILKMDPIPNPFYVRKARDGSLPALTGTVTDNVGVDKVIYVNAATGEELFPVIRNGDNWKVELAFTEEQNGEKIVTQVIAYDKMGNSDANSMAFATLIIDIREPIIEYIDIKRTDTRMADIENFSALKALEKTDPKGERKADLYRYQNGWFYINAMVSDKETKVQVISLEIYDTQIEGDTLKQTFLISFNIDNGYTPYNPRWTVKEEVIINAGAAIFGDEYRTNYYENKARYYYQVVIKALDMSENQSDILEEDEGYICMWARSDEPKGIVDPGIGAIVSRGTPFPVDFYDDDSLLWAYTGLLTDEQWNGTKAVAEGDKKINGSNDEAKLLWLKENLTGAEGDSIVINKSNSIPIYNWRYDKYTQEVSPDSTISEQIGTSNIDEKLVYVPTGNMEADYGNYVLFTIVADKKLSPHTGEGPEWTNKRIWAGRAEYVQVIDENTPLIVFDTEGKPSWFCPEENTFPEPLLDIDGKYVNEQKYFEIKGYTLRENASGFNSVLKFRMAWIPFGMDGGPDKYITDVQAALRSDTFAGMPQNVQYWNFTSGVPKAGEGKFITEPDFEIDTNTYKKQSFRLKFSVMGDPDELKPGEYNNFTYKEKLENETKLFVFYAMDNMGHEVYRQLRLLGYREEPDLTVYDITNIINVEDMISGYPDPTGKDDSGKDFTDPSTGSPTNAYYDKLNIYNKKPEVYSKIKTGATSFPGFSDPKADKTDILTIPFQIYPRNTILKYYVKAENTGKIPIDSITMQDITFKSKEDAPFVGSDYNSSDITLSFAEFFPDVTQRTFLFIATDKLGNTRQIQRSIAVTNAARLERITTTTQTGTYGIGTTITIRAEFSGLIYIGTGDPKLHVRYKNAAGTAYIYEALTIPTTKKPTSTNPATALEFDFIVKEGYTGTLETMYENIVNTPGVTGDPIDKRPIVLDGATIMDYSRKDSAFIPGYSNTSVTMPNWTTDKDTLQKKKTITLDGIRPTITTVVWGGKGNPGDDLYFKTGETITLTVSSLKNIRAQGDSKFQYYIRDRDTGGTKRGPYTADFKYQRPGGSAGAKNILIYSLTVNNTNCPFDGRIEDVTIITSGVEDKDTYVGIVDDVGNSVVKTGVTGLLPLGNTKISVKQSKPAAPAATLSNVNAGYTNKPFTDTDIRLYYNGGVTFNIPDSNATLAAWEDTKEYSTNGGIAWTKGLSSSVTGPGTYQIQTRYVDRAGNEGTTRNITININNTFPALMSVNTVQANGTYRAGGRLTFNLNFAAKVSVKTPGDVSIMLKNRQSTTTGNNEHTITLTAAQTNVTTVVFDWPSISGKEMRDGLYISNINLSGLEDEYGLKGPSGVIGDYDTNDGTISIDSCRNLKSGVIVDAIPPTVTGKTPPTTPNTNDNNLVKSITITFNEPVMKGSGIITIRPRGEYAIPPVLDDTGYYLGYTSNGKPTGGTELQTGIPTKFPTSGTNRTYISSFYDIYNTLTNSTHRGYLAAGTSMSNLTPSTRTGLNTGPYIKTTQGLIEGFGYLANYSGGAAATGTNGATNNGITSGANSPNANAYTAMVPDTATKWVLDYKYPISVPAGNDTTLNAQRDVVNNIRTALTNAKWRWQEIDVVTAPDNEKSNTITINLNEPLLKGLIWDVYYPAGTFTDLAGNPAPASGVTVTDPTAWTNSDFSFTTPGVQAPVIRVNRRSSDSRTSNWGDKKTYDTVTDTSSWGSNTTVVTDTTGWGSGNFRYIHYRVESESSVIGSGVTVSASYYKGVADNDNRTAAKGDWTGNVQTANYTPATLAIPGHTGITGTNYTDSAWNRGAENNTGQWITPNIVFRSRTSGTTNTYTVVTKNEVKEDRTSTGTLRMYKSYNRDLTAAELGIYTGTPSASLTFTASSLSTVDTTKGQAVLSFYNDTTDTGDFEASKCYIVGAATYNGVTARGVEGIFRTVMMFNSGNTARASDFIAIEGSNIKNGMPSIAGFPVRDADEYDCRFFKVCYKASGGTDRTRFYWVSTEIVSEWYFIGWAGGTNSGTQSGTHMNVGEVNNYIMSGYGDLTYVYAVSMSSQP